MAINVPAVTEYIRRAAIERGIDPDIAVRVARSEGLAPGVWQSNVVKNGQRETSYGPFQLLVGGGLGDQFISQTGMDPRDPSTVNAQVDFALDQAARGGWSPWYGAEKVGVNDWTGIRGAKPDAPSPPSPAGGDRAVGGTRETPGPSVFGSMSPVPGDVARYATSEDPKPFGERLQEAARALEDSAPSPPRVGRMGDARSTGNALLKTLNSPTVADQLFRKRMAGVG